MAAPVLDAADAPSRTCYEHLAGRIGVGLYRLRDRYALRERPYGLVDLDPAAAETFAQLGVDIAAVRPGRQRLAFECLDATERAPHLAGALGDAPAAALFEQGWVVRDGRTIELSRRGAAGLRRLGLAL